MTTQLQTNGRGLLVIDPDTSPDPFDRASMLHTFEQGRNDDDHEVQAILSELETLANEFTLWSYARIKMQDASDLESLQRTSQEIFEEEQQQDERRSSLRMFLDTIATAVKRFTGGSG